MKTALLFLMIGVALFQRELNPNLLTETMAAQMANDYAEIKLRGEGPAFHSTKAAWTGVFRDGRWHMRHEAFTTVGWTVSVSFKADGSDKKLETFSFSTE